MGALHWPRGSRDLSGAARHGGGGGRLGSGAPPSRWPRAVGAGVGGCGVCGACAVRAVVRGVAFRLSLWCPPLRCFVAVLCLPCACCASFPTRIICSAAGYPLFLSWLRRSLPFPLLSVGSPFSLARTFSLPPPWCVSRSFSLPARLSLLLGPVRQRKDGGMWAFGGLVRSPCNILYPRWHHDCWGCVLRCAAYNTPVSALVSTCVRTLFTLRAIPWCACPWRWRLCCACADRPVCCVPTPSPALMAYREREGGAALCTSLSLSISGPPFLVAFAAAGSCSFAIPCLCMLARVGIHTIHTIISSFRLGCPLGIPSYHSCSVPRRWRPLVCRLFVGGVHSLALAASSRVDGL